MTEALRDALGQIAGKNDLSGVPDDDLESAARNALHECELIARAALAATPAVGGEPVAWQAAVDLTEKSILSEYYSGRLNGDHRIKEGFKSLRAALAALPASPLRGRELMISALAEKFEHRPSSGTFQYATECVDAMLAAAPPEQPAAAPWHQEPSDDEKIDHAEDVLSTSGVPDKRTMDGETGV